MLQTNIILFIGLIINTLLLLLDKNNKFLYGFRTMNLEEKQRYDMTKAKHYLLCYNAIIMVLTLAFCGLWYYHSNIHPIKMVDVLIPIELVLLIIVVFFGRGKHIQKVSKIQQILKFNQ